MHWKKDMEGTLSGVPSKWLRAFFTLTFREKAVLFLVPTIVIISLVYTLESIYSERLILRNEIIKKGETIAVLAGRNAELPILSENLEQLKHSADAIMGIKDVAFVSFFNKNCDSLMHEGTNSRFIPACGIPRGEEIAFSEHKDFFEFTAPVFAVRAKGEIDLFQDRASSAPVKEFIGMVRIGLSKEIMARSEDEIIERGGFLAVIFTSAGVLLVYIFISIASRPLHSLLNAVKEVREGEYSEVKVSSPMSEIGSLSSEFNRMSRAIREREEKLVASEKRIKDLFERVEHAIFKLGRNGAILVANNKFRELCGEASDFQALFPGNNGQQYLEKASLGMLRQVEAAITRRDGNEFVVVMSIYPEIDADGSVAGFDGYFVDITDKKKLEQLLIHTQKMESVGLLAGGIAHDFNNILTGVLGYSSLIKNSVKEDDKLYRYAEVIEKSAIRASGLTRQLL
ncbi:MAG: histidine kinase dimerization/phospho-acceptor domain-containing protein, partial [Dissulfurispiraceae bacterium]